MTPKQNKHLFNFIYCAVVVAFFAMVGGCTRACARKMEKDARKYQERKTSPRRYRNSIHAINFNLKNYGYQL